MNYPKKTGFNLYKSRHCAYITYSVKILSVFKAVYKFTAVVMNNNTILASVKLIIGVLVGICHKVTKVILKN